MLKVSSRYFVLKSGYRTQVIPENTVVHVRPSLILEGWYDVFLQGYYAGTIPLSELKENFKMDNLLWET